MSVTLACADEISPRQGPFRVPTPAEGCEVGATSQVRPRPRHVLVTDDNPGMRQTLTEILSVEGYTVLEAENGRAALAILENTPVDALILDLAMPFMDGVELLTRIDPPPPVVIICSAFAYFHPDEVDRQVGAKVFRMLRKPVHAAQLVSVVADAIAQLGDE